MTLRERIEEAATRAVNLPSGLRPLPSGRKDLRGCTSCREKMLAQMKAKRGLDP